MCDILLTEDILYVLEHVWGEDTTHFEIPCNHIERIAKCSGSGERKRGSALSPIVGGLVGYLMSASNDSSGGADDLFMILLHPNRNGSQRAIYFNETQGSLKGFIKAFERIQAHRVSSHTK